MIISRFGWSAGVCALAALPACSKDDAVVSPFAADRVEPTGVYVSTFDPALGPTLEWAHDDENETGFVVEWWTGDAGQPQVVGTPEAGARRFTHPGYDAGAVNGYRVRAEYGPNLTGFDGIIRMDPRLDGPENASLSPLPGDSIAVSWNPADFTPFDGFRVRRLVGISDELDLESDRIVIVASSLEVTWVDAPPPGTAFDERLRYLVETRTLETFSPPSTAGELAWQYPTRPTNIVIGGPEDTDVRVRHSASYGRTVLTYDRETGVALEMVEFEVETGVRSAIIVTADDGELRGAPMSVVSAMVAHRAASGEVTLSAFDELFGAPLWTVDRSASHVPEMGPAGPGEAFVAYDDTIERVDGGDGSVLDTIPLDPLVAGGQVLDFITDHPEAALILRTTEDGASAPGLALQRIDLTASGTVAYTRSLSVGHVPASLVASASGEWVAVNYDQDENGMWRSLLYDAISGTPQSTVVAGRAIAFSSDGAHVVLIDEAGFLVAVRLDGSLTVEDRFGRSVTRGGYVESDGALISYQTEGRVNRYKFERRWSTPIHGAEPRQVEGDVPTSMWKREASSHAL